MYNNTLTLSEKYYILSSIAQEEIPIIKESQRELSLEECIFNFGYLYSIELSRTKIKKELNEYFDFDTQYEELDYLAANTKLLQILPSIGNYVKNVFDNKSRLVLELMTESKDWQTLFINIHTNMDWEKSNRFIDTILENLFELYPEIATRLNVNIIPDEF